MFAYKGNTANGYITVSNAVVIGQWAHVTCAYNQGTVTCYINGIQAATANGFSFNNILKTSNFIGKGNWGNPYVNAMFDELKIFNRPLNLAEINSEMNKLQPYVITL